MKMMEERKVKAMEELKQSGPELARKK